MMVRSRFLMAYVALTAACAAPSQRAAAPAPRVVLLDGRALAANRRAVKAGDLRLAPAVARLEDDALRALVAGPFTVTGKSAAPPGGDKHDYMSLAPYWWPDPSRPDGKPYIRRDGETNPEVRKYTDKAQMGGMTDAVYTLSLAWYFTGRTAFAGRAGLLLRAWFIDPATRMNPNLRHAQAVPGRNDGRGTGIIESRGLVRIVEAVGLLEGSGALTDGEDRQVRQWFEDYLDWLLQSKPGRDEGAARNNHGTFFDVQVAAFALFVGRTDLARRVVEEAKQKRIARQVEPDGRQPLEMARTRSWGYSVMNLNGLVDLAILGDRLGIDLWNFETPDGRGIRKAVEFLAPAAMGDRRWEGRDIRGVDPRDLHSAIRQAAPHYPNGPLPALLRRIPAPGVTDRANLLRGSFVPRLYLRTATPGDSPRSTAGRRANVVAARVVTGAANSYRNRAAHQTLGATRKEARSVNYELP